MEGIVSPVTGVTGSYEPPDVGARNQNFSPLLEKQELLIAELFTHPGDRILVCCPGYP